MLERENMADEATPKPGQNPEPDNQDDGSNDREKQHQQPGKEDKSGGEQGGQGAEVIHARMDPRTREVIEGHPNEAALKAIEKGGEEARAAIEKIIDAEDSTSPEGARDYTETVDILVNAAMKEGKVGLARYILEYALERMIGRGDFTPRDPYPQFNLYESGAIDSILSSARRADKEANLSTQDSIFIYLSKLRTSRQATHELFRDMRNEEQFTQGVAQYLNREGLQFVEHQIVGVAKTQRLYEKVWARMVSRNKRMPLPEDFERADRELQDTMMRVGKAGGLRNDWGDYRPGDSKNQPTNLREWQIKRASMEGMRLGALSQRRLTYAVLGDVSTNFVDFLRSVEGEFIARNLAALKLIPKRFFHGPHGWHAQDFFLKKIAENFRRGATYGLKKGEVRHGLKKETEWEGLYGQSEESFTFLDTGAVDAKSNSWRAQALFLRQPNFEIEEADGKKVSIGRYLDHMNDRAKEKGEEGAGERFNEAIRERIKAQRLFLGVLMRYGGLDAGNKTAIWENVARFMPSRIAAFLPNEAREIIKGVYKASADEEANEKWDKLLEKLHLIEEQRVNDDAIRLDSKLTDEQKKDKLGTRSQDLQDLEYYFDPAHTPGIEALTPQELEVIKKLQELGREKAGGFAQIKFPFTSLLDDVPATNWEGISAEDLPRLLLSDQKNFTKGSGIITGLIQDPIKKPEDAIKALKEALEAYASPLGTPDAQGKMLVYMTAYIELTKSSPYAKFLGALYKLLRMPRSELEKANLKANIAHNEIILSDFIDAAAQQEIIADEKKGGVNAYLELKRRFHADRLGVLVAWLRLIQFLLGPTLAVAVLKDMLPEGMQKALG